MTFHANQKTYKFMIVNKLNGKRQVYLNSKELCAEYDINRSTLYRILTGKPSRKHDSNFVFVRIRIPVDNIV